MNHIFDLYLLIYFSPVEIHLQFRFDLFRHHYPTGNSLVIFNCRTDIFDTKTDCMSSDRQNGRSAVRKWNLVEVTVERRKSDSNCVMFRRRSLDNTFRNLSPHLTAKMLRERHLPNRLRGCLPQMRWLRSWSVRRKHKQQKVRQECWRLIQKKSKYLLFRLPLPAKPSLHPRHPLQLRLLAVFATAAIFALKACEENGELVIF